MLHVNRGGCHGKAGQWRNTTHSKHSHSWFAFRSKGVSLSSPGLSRNHTTPAARPAKTRCFSASCRVNLENRFYQPVTLAACTTAAQVARARRGRARASITSLLVARISDTDRRYVQTTHARTGKEHLNCHTFRYILGVHDDGRRSVLQAHSWSHGPKYGMLSRLTMTTPTSSGWSRRKLLCCHHTGRGVSCHPGRSSRREWRRRQRAGNGLILSIGYWAGFKAQLRSLDKESFRPWFGKLLEGRWSQ